MIPLVLCSATLDAMVVPALLQCGRGKAWTQIINGLATSFLWCFCGLPFETAVIWTSLLSTSRFAKDKGITDLIQNGAWSRCTVMPLSFLAQVTVRSFCLLKSKHKYLNISAGPHSEIPSYFEEEDLEWLGIRRGSDMAGGKCLCSWERGGW